MFIHGGVDRGIYELRNGVSYRTHSLLWLAYDSIILAQPVAFGL